MFRGGGSGQDWRSVRDGKPVWQDDVEELRTFEWDDFSSLFWLEIKFSGYRKRQH
jgi:hypothetical protein